MFLTPICKFDMLKVRNFPSYHCQIASIINKSKLLRLSILSAGFHPFFVTSGGDTVTAKIRRAFRFLSKDWMINHAVLYSLVPFGLCVCVCVYTYAIRSYSRAHMRHRAVYLLANENSSTSKTGEKPS